MGNASDRARLYKIGTYTNSFGIGSAFLQQLAKNQAKAKEGLIARLDKRIDSC